LPLRHRRLPHRNKAIHLWVKELVHSGKVPPEAQVELIRHPKKIPPDPKERLREVAPSRRDRSYRSLPE